jgi:hypothetical protein
VLAGSGAPASRVASSVTEPERVRTADRGPVQRFLPPIAVAVFAIGVGVIVLVAGSTLGYDFQAYVAAAHRVLEGQRLYDPNVSVAGGFAIYLYPPPFALAMIPFALAPDQVGLWAWLGTLLVAFLAGVALLPVRAEIRWAILLLAGLQWPFLYSIKLGQVGPLLFLAFVIGWRWLDRPGPLGASMAVGALIKVQPGLLFGWALATRRWRAFAIGTGVIVVAAVIATVALGFGTWADYIDLLRKVSTPVTTPHNFTPGAIAFQLGSGETTATLIEAATVLVALVVAVAAWLRADSESSYIVTVVASQLISPLLWDHYAMLLLLPTALLLQRRQWWAVLIPLAGWLSAPVYPILFLVSLLAPLLGAGPRPGVPGPAIAAPITSA